ncbi:MAG: hypothetical protein ACFFCW_07615 [Candidatus Hodarchaeota archaeon]
MAGVTIRLRKAVFKAPMDIYTSFGAFFVWPFIGADTEINKDQ